MPMVAVATLLELDAAEALLELQGEMRERQPVSCTLCLPDFQYGATSPAQLNEEIESSATAALFLNSLFLKKASSLKTSLPGPSTQKSSPSTHYLKNNYQLNRRVNYNGINNNLKRSSQYTSKRQFNVIKRLEPPCKKRLLQKNQETKPQRACWAEIVNKSRPDEVKESRDCSTQTEVEYQLPQIDKMEAIIKDLCGKIETLENKLKMQSDSKSPYNNVVNKKKIINHNVNDISDNVNVQFSTPRTLTKQKRSSNNIDADWETPKSKSKIKREDRESDNNVKTPLRTKYKANVSGDLVPIGDGNALVPGRLLKHMDWSSYTNATRKLLRAVFPRNVLATHSLTGKPSPAFPNKPAKKQLDPALVNDIVQTVVENCSVPESVVRTSITTKCADESKMFRSRMRKNKRPAVKIDQENIPPTACGSDESDESYLSN